MSWVRERLGLEKPKSQPKQQKDEYGIRARLGLIETPKTTAPKFASTNEKMDNLSSQRNFAAEKLAESRKNYQDYLKEETKDTRALKVSPLSSPMSTDLTAKTPEMLNVAQKQAQALEKAVKSEKGQELKQDIKEKQSEFNYANYLKNVEDVNNMKVTAPQKVYNPIISGAADLLQTDRLDPESQYYYDENGNKSYLPTKRKLKQEKIREKSGKVGQVYNDVAYNLTKAIGSKLIDAFAPGAGTMLYYGGIVNDSVEEAKNQGYSNAEALAYGAGVGAIAGTLDKFMGTFGGLSNISSKIPTLSQGLDTMFYKITSKKAASTILSNMTSEALSEYVEEYADNALKYIINADQSEYDSFFNMLGETMPNAWYAALIGGISGGAGGVMENITNNSEMIERKQALEDYKQTLEDYKPQTIAEAQYKEDQIVQVEQIEQAIDEKEQETIEKANDLSKLSDKELEDLKLAQEIFGLDTKETEQEIKNRTDFIDETEEELLNQPNEKEQEVEEAKDLLGFEDRQFKKSSLNKLTDEQLENVKSSLETLEMDTTNITEEQKYRADQKEKATNPMNAIKEQNKFIESSKKMLGLQTNKKNIKNNYTTLSQENNYTKAQTKVVEQMAQDIIDIARNEQEVNDLVVLTSPPAKSQQSTKIKTEDGNVTTHYNPSQKIVQEGENAIYKYIQDKVTSTEKKRIETQNKKTMQSITKAIDRLDNNGNKVIADIYRDDLENYTYEVEHIGDKGNKNYKSLTERLNTGNTDIEMEYSNLQDEYNELHDSGKWNEIDKTTNNQQNKLDWLEKASALLDLLERDKSGDYSYVTKDLSYKVRSEEHYGGQILNLASQEAKKNPDNIPKYLMNNLINMYEQELKAHAGDQLWLDANNPYDLTNNSPFRLSNEEWNTITRLSAELSTIDQKKNNFEYQVKLNEINNYAAQTMANRLYGIKGISKQIKNWAITQIKLNNLMSFHVSLYNIASNIADTIGLNQIEKLGTNIAEKQLSKTTGFATQQYTAKGQSIHYKGVIEGIKTVGKEFMTGVKLSDMSSKYSPVEKVDFSKIGKLDYKLRAKTKLGKILITPTNLKNKIVGTILSFGDTPKSTAVRNESLYNQLNQEAIRQSVVTGKDSIFYTLTDEKSGNVTYYYTNSNGETMTRTFPTNEASDFLNDRNQIEATETMLEIAQDDGERAVYVGKNVLTDKALKWKDTLNSTLPGLGDLTLQFTTVAQNMAVQFHQHSPSSIPNIVIKSKTLQKNMTAINNKINEYYDNGKDYTKTKEYADKMNENYKLQHELGLAYGKVLSGIAVTSAMLILKALGIATGDVDKDDEDEGIQDYSIKLGDKYISYDFGLFGMLAKSGAIAYDAFTGEDNLLVGSISAMQGYGETVLEQTFVKELLDTFTSEYGETFKDRLADFFIGNVSSLTTPGFIKEITLAADDYTARSTYSNDKWQYLINRLNANWNRKALPKKFDGWGNTIKKGTTLIDSAWNTFFKTDFISHTKNDNLDKELAELYQATGETSILPLKTNGSYRNNINSFSYKNTKYTLTDKEKEKFSETYGKYAYENLNKLINSGIYKKADNVTKVSYIEQIYTNALDEAKKEYLQEHGINYYNAGQKVLILGDKNRYEQAAILDAIDNNISYESAKYMQNNPQEYKYATTIVKDYEIYNHASSMYNHIKDLYPKTSDRKSAYVNYVNTCSNLSAVQKAMLIKTYYSSMYKSYDNQIKAYLQKQNLSNEEYKYALEKMGIIKKNKN